VSLLSDPGGGGSIESKVDVIGVEVGGLSDGNTIPAGTSLHAILKMILQKRIGPVYLAPTLSLSGSGTKSVEAGTSVAPTLTPTFTQNDAGAVSSFKVQKNGTDTFTETTVGPYSPTAAVIGDEAWNFKAFADHSAGAVKNDNMGDPDNTGQILAGTVSSGTVTYYGKRNTFHDCDTLLTAPTNSADVRSLTNTILGQTDGDTLTINVPAGTRRIVFAYPATLRDVSAVHYFEQGNANYTDMFDPTLVNVEGAGGFTATPYKVYTWLIAVPTQAAMTLNVLI
jgi:hypothetical protein